MTWSNLGYKTNTFDAITTVENITTLCCFTMVQGHGRLLEPPSRSSMFRFAYVDPMLFPYRDVIQSNYNDNELSCGGRQVQIDNNGKCGVCGDSFTARVKENEAGGKYALGIITRNYKQGQVIVTTVEITAEHKGYFEFRLCPWNNVNVPVTHECLNENLLRFENNETRWYLPENPSQAKGLHHLKLKLPNHITCQQCVLQWRYRTGNSWGYENGEQGLGLGQQEEFYGCSDVSIQPDQNPPSSIAATDSSSPNDDLLPTTFQSSGISGTHPAADDTSSTVTKETTIKSVSSTEISSTTKIAETQNPVIDCSKVKLGQPIFRDCNSFYVCAFAQYDPFIFKCPTGTVCDPSTGRCDHPYNVSPPCN